MSAESNRLLNAENITYKIQGRQILKDISLTVSRGEIVTLIGPNGAGKSTLIRLILGLVSPDKGEVSLKKSLRIGYMPQKLVLSDNLPLSVKRFMELSNHGSSRQIDSIAKQLAIPHLLNSPMQKLSGGEHQRVLLARALLCKPELLVLDEPVQGVDITGQSELYQLIKSIRDQSNCGVVMVSHDLHLVMASTDKVLCINQHVCCSGHPDTVSKHPAYLELFSDMTDAELAIYRHHHNHTHDIHGDTCTQDHQHG